jgi:hypothetical protein
MSKEPKNTSNRNETYREPSLPRPVGPEVTKDETYREPKPSGGSQGNEKK